MCNPISISLLDSRATVRGRDGFQQGNSSASMVDTLHGCPLLAVEQKPLWCPVLLWEVNRVVFRRSAGGNAPWSARWTPRPWIHTPLHPSWWSETLGKLAGDERREGAHWNGPAPGRVLTGAPCEVLYLGVVIWWRLDTRANVIRVTCAWSWVFVN